VVRFDKSTADKGRQYVRDRRGSRSGSGARRGGRGVAVGGGLGGILVAVLAALFGLGGLGGGGGSAFDIDSTGFDTQAGAVSDSGPTDTVDPDADTVQYMEALMFDIQDTWDEYFDQAGLNYEPTTLTIFTDSVSTGCGNATSQTGPFYCPAPNDMGVYIDLAFYDDLRTRFGAPGDFAQAYVIAHEIGHHLQAILGISEGVRKAQAEDPGNRNEYSIRQELQADCLAGVWAHSASNRLTRDTGQPILERGDIEEGLAAAASVGDDRIQAQAGMTIDPHTWTHGSADQRVGWFTTGFDTGDPEQCDTFAASEL
jgi:predicted metalloprotease